MRHGQETITRFTISRDQYVQWRARLEPCGSCVWISRTCRCARHNVVGVPARSLDVLVQDDLAHDDTIVCEVSEKEGRYDGSVRTRIAFRRRCDGMDLDASTIAAEDDGTDLVITVTLPSGTWTSRHRILRAMASESLGAARDIVLWHWSRYYRHLSAETADSVASRLVIAPGTTITSANRLASALLYEESRAIGWRKLTRRERTRLGYGEDAGQWQRTDDVYARRGERTGCGDYTIDSARGVHYDRGGLHA
jgi:hypothetical protein